MAALASDLGDSTAALLLKGYTWLPDRLRRGGAGPVRTRLLGRPAVALHGPEAVGFFYDERNVRRRDALPGPVLDTLFGRGAVHTLDGEAHRVRKALFVERLTDAEAVSALVERVREEWRRAFEARGGTVVLFDEAALVLARAVSAWAGIALSEAWTRRLARDAVAMVDGFATPGPRHLRARVARLRQQRRIERLVNRRRSHGDGPGPAPTVLSAVTWHRDADGRLLDARTAAVELLNVVRPTVAIAWFVTFAAHALHRWPEHRDRLADEPAYALAFAHEVRRFYPFAPFLGGLAARDTTWQGTPVPEGTMLLLDVYGHNHDPALWPDPYHFHPDRFLGRAPGADEMIPQGGGDAATGHRCPGEDITVAVLKALSAELATLDHTVPDQDLRISLRRIPARPRSGFRMTLGGPGGR
ncbi:cytochrome P450 [Streptomyces purpureus]|uniref:cytochrome P450 n=1 Tax=Streptomyces purpureus TaxID=1951 RepID=UPI0037AE6436